MIFNLSAGDNTSEEVEVLLTELETEINTLMTELKSDVESMITKLNNDVSSAVATLSTRGAVKSIQRGIANNNTTDLINININTVNPDKCLVILNSSSTADIKSQPTLKSLTSNLLTVTSASYYNGYDYYGVSFSWQVVEFY